MNADLRVYFITDPQLCARLGLIETVLQAVAGGATLVQLRDPHAKGRALLEQARALVAALKPSGVPLVVNDRPDIAVAAGAQGVHVGQDDVPPALARTLMGPDAIVGLSTTSADQVRRVPWGLVDHVGVGPVFGPGVKTDANPTIGLKGLKECVELAQKPVVAIGGVSRSGAADCIAMGAAGVAVVSAIAAHENPRGAAADLRRIVDDAFAQRRTPR